MQKLVKNMGSCLILAKTVHLGQVKAKSQPWTNRLKYWLHYKDMWVELDLACH